VTEVDVAVAEAEVTEVDVAVAEVAAEASEEARAPSSNPTDTKECSFPKAKKNQLQPSTRILDFQSTMKKE